MELKYIFLKAKLENQEQYLDSGDFYKIIENQIGWKEYNLILQESVINSLLDSATHSQLTNLGKSRLKELEKELNQTKNDKNAERKRLHNETIISDWKRKTFWWLFGFAILGSILSIYNFINNLKTTNSDIKLENKIDKMDSKIEKFKDSMINLKSIETSK